ncbi:MAG: methyltransferase [Bacilli bacterium]
MNQYFSNEKLASNIKTIKVKMLDKDFIFNTDNGVFSKSGLDFGTQTLLKTILPLHLTGKVLDVGCGYGVIGIILSKFEKVFVDMIDVNERAIHLAKMNIKINEVINCNPFISNCYTEITNKYNYIITNPPIRAGKKVVYEIVIKAKEHLEDNGKLFIVIRKEQGAKSMIKDLSTYYDVNVLKKEKGYFILKCEKK